jgi:hypothetical protein
MEAFIRPERYLKEHPDFLAHTHDANHGRPRHTQEP